MMLFYLFLTDETSAYARIDSWLIYLAGDELQYSWIEGKAAATAKTL